MNSARVCWTIRRTVLNVYACLNHSRRYDRKQFAKRDEKPRHQRQFLQNFANFLYVDGILYFRKW